MTFEIARRNRIDQYTPAETAIREAVGAVEAAGCHPLLTDAVVLLGQAQSKVADFVDMPKTTPYHKDDDVPDYVTVDMACANAAA